MARAAVAVVLVGVALSVASMPACTRTSDGVPTAGDATRSAPTPETSQSPQTSQTSQTPEASETPDVPGPGIVPTPAPAGGPCVPADLPAVRVVADVAEPGAPTATVGVPQGWSTSSGTGDGEGARVEGPDNMEAIILITATSLPPEQAFSQWIDDLTRDADISTVSTLPGQMCGFSGQTMMGTLADATQSVEFRDRLIHVPAASQNYLIVVHTEAPAGTPGFTAAAALLTRDFEIGLP